MNKIKDILANIGNVKVGTWVRGILLIISFVNMALSAAGKAPIPADYNELYTIVSVIFSILVGISAHGRHRQQQSGWKWGAMYTSIRLTPSTTYSLASGFLPT